MFKISCQWLEVVDIEVPADSLEEAIQKVKAHPELVLDYGGEYLSDSFEVNEDLTVEQNQR